MNRLKILREEYNKSQIEVANYLDITSQAYGLYENDKRGIPLDKLRKLSDYFNCSIDYILNKTDDRKSNSKTTYIPIIGKVKAGYDFLAEENRIGSVEVENDLIKDNEMYFAVVVVGDSMSHTFEEDDILIIKKQEDFESGQYVVALINENEVTVKKARKNVYGIDLIPKNTDKYEIMSFTNEQILNKEVVILGIVKRAMRNFF